MSPRSSSPRRRAIRLDLLAQAALSIGGARDPILNLLAQAAPDVRLFP
jgi:hypothetical protein